MVAYGECRQTIDWGAIDLVVFDVDGTLYDQTPLRLRMLIELGMHSCRTMSLSDALTLRTFRRCREELSREQGTEDFTNLQYIRAAERRRMDPGDVRETVRVWLEERPLQFLRNYCLDGVAELFDACRKTGKGPAVWSDYPASAKLAALGLSASIIVDSGEEGVRRLKPDPAGLHRILSLASVAPHRVLLIGDRTDHDGEASRRAGVQTLIRRPAPHAEFATFASYRDPLFNPLLRQARASPNQAAPLAENAR